MAEQERKPQTTMSDVIRAAAQKELKRRARLADRIVLGAPREQQDESERKHGGQ